MFTDSLKDDIHTVKGQGHRGNRASLTIRIKHEESKLSARATRTEDHAKARVPDKLTIIPVRGGGPN